MKLLFFIFLIPIVASFKNDTTLIQKIVEATSVAIEDVPYHAALEDARELFCGGCIIGKTRVVTAARCVADKTIDNMWIRVGSTLKRTAGVIVHIKQIVIHPQYDNKTHNNNIAVLQTEKMEFCSNAKSIDVVGPNFFVMEDIEVKLSGWGLSRVKEHVSTTLQSATVRIVDGRLCEQVYNISKLQYGYCASATFDAACAGLAGIPAVYNNTLVGIVSGGSVCPPSQKPFVLTSVSSYSDWIKNATSENVDSEVKLC